MALAAAAATYLHTASLLAARPVLGGGVVVHPQVGVRTHLHWSPDLVPPPHLSPPQLQQQQHTFVFYQAAPGAGASRQPPFANLSVMTTLQPLAQPTTIAAAAARALTLLFLNTPF